jgi:Zn-dependent peptidase ImmA (M78 family)
LLVPDDFLASIRDEERPDDVSRYDEWLERPRKEWGVSADVILRRLLDAGHLTQSRYTAYRHWREQLIFIATDEGNRKYRHREPKHIFGDTFVRTVLDALNARQITLTKASSYLDSLKIKDLHKLERHYTVL